MYPTKNNLFPGKSTILAALLATPLFLSPLPALAQPNSSPSELDAVLKGFEEEATEQAPANELDSVLEGFDDEAGGQPADASSDQALNAVLDGFGGEEQTEVQKEDGSTTSWFPAWLSIDGWLQFGTTYTIAHDAPTDGETDWRGFSKARTDLQIDLDARFSDAWSAKVGAKGFYDGIYSIEGRDEYT
ncbi:MAG: hypothetical protein D3925_14390, partial [Candidatus Electrothrix sp. AR5]|nr:hypothetical protein [Candidatus Electrothrix sp. AR5]